MLGPKAHKERWTKAAVIGGLWASVEIIVGSFLHNTRLPFAGTILAVAGTILLIGFYQQWPQRGLIIRAGLITALMKSVSPSAIILGPMTGIMMEAIFIELTIRLVGANRAGFILAGILSVSSALLHKIISLIIVYGLDLVQVYVNIINFALKQFRIAEAAPVQILMALLLVYMVVGLIAGNMGLWVGKKALAMSSADIPISTELGNRGEFFPVSDQTSPSVLHLWLHLLAIPTGLFLLNYVPFQYGLLFAVVYGSIFGYRYRAAMRRLRKPVFWTQLVIIVVLSTLFWNGTDSGFHPSRQGAYVGMEMMIRALFIIMAFTSLSVELRNKRVKSFLVNAGMGQLYRSLEMAFGALPIMISLLPGSREIFRNPLQSLLKPLAMANQWFELFSREEE